MGILFIGMTTLMGCKKEDMSKYVTKDELSQGQVSSSPKIENISLTIKSYEWTWNSIYNRWEYKYSHSFINNGVLVGYVLDGGEQFLPYYDANTGNTWGLIDYTFGSPSSIIVTYYDGTTSLQKPSSDTYVYLKVIPSSGLKTHPNLDFTNYKEVSKAFNIE